MRAFFYDRKSKVILRKILLTIDCIPDISSLWIKNQLFFDIFSREVCLALILIVFSNTIKF